eukprot:766009-Hanusia_phi.AAC.2
MVTSRGGQEGGQGDGGMQDNGAAEEGEASGIAGRRRRSLHESGSNKKRPPPLSLSVPGNSS